MSAQTISRLIKDRCGIVVPERKLETIVNTVRSKFPGASLEDAAARLEVGPGLPDWLITATTINETFFFRHPEQFKFVETWLEGRRPHGRIKALCLGCSTGEEPYSLAMVLNEVLGAGQFEITAVDLDPQALETAKEAHYPESSISRTPAGYRGVLLRNITRLKSGTGGIQINSIIRNSVRFIRGNLMKVPLGNYDFVLARNVLIYLSPEDRARVLERLRTHIPRDGVVIIGAGELPTHGEQWESERSTWCLRRAA